MYIKIVTAPLVIPNVTRDLTSHERFATPSINREIPRFARNDN
jgi:hypothetical protein